MTPESLSEVPRDSQVRQTFGWHPVLIGLVSLGFAIPIASDFSSTFQATVGILLGLVLLGFLSLFYEWYRRRNRVVLCRVPEGVAVYRKGKHDLTVQPQQIGVYALNWGNTFQYLFLPGVMIVGLAAAFTKMGPSVGVVIMAVVLVSSTSSLVHTRILCKHRLVPKQSGRNQQVIFRRADIARLFS